MVVKGVRDDFEWGYYWGHYGCSFICALSPPSEIYSLAKRASFSCCALMKASLKRLASAILVNSWLELLKVCARVLTLAVGEADRERLSLGLAFADIRGGIPDPAAVAADVGRQLHVGDDCESMSATILP